MCQDFVNALYKKKSHCLKAREIYARSRIMMTRIMVARHSNPRKKLTQIRRCRFYIAFIISLKYFLPIAHAFRAIQFSILSVGVQTTFVGIVRHHCFVSEIDVFVQSLKRDADVFFGAFRLSNAHIGFIISVQTVL